MRSRATPLWNPLGRSRPPPTDPQIFSYVRTGRRRSSSTGGRRGRHAPPGRFPFHFWRGGIFRPQTTEAAPGGSLGRAETTKAAPGGSLGRAETTKLTPREGQALGPWRRSLGGRHTPEFRFLRLILIDGKRAVLVLDHVQRMRRVQGEQRVGTQNRRTGATTERLQTRLRNFSPLGGGVNRAHAPRNHGVTCEGTKKRSRKVPHTPTTPYVNGASRTIATRF